MAVKNFPHQINQLPRLTRALGVFARVIEKNQDVDDDGVVGDALARAEVYTFRSPGTKTIEELIQIEHGKTPANQGTRTCARELRRFFSLLGFIHKTDNAAWEVSQSAQALLALNKNQLPMALDIWRQALLDMELTDAGGSSHPYQILLRLVMAVPGLFKPYSGLCLEARNDTEAEFDRIRTIATKVNPSATMNVLAGTHMAKNSIKILPSIAVQLGDIHDDGSRLYISERVADVLAAESETETIGETIQKLVRHPYKPRKRPAEGKRREQGAAQPVLRSFDPDLVGARFNAHEDCLDRLSKLFPAHIDRLQASYDLLLVAPKLALLVEAKTIREDARRQMRLALGQLFFYEHFDVVPLHPDKEILRLALTDRVLGEDLQKFLTKHRIGVIWILDSGRLGGTDLGLAHLHTLGAKV